MQPTALTDVALQRNLRLFVIGICCAVLAMYTVTTLHARDVALFVARREMLNLAQSLLAEESNAFELADRSVLDVAERVHLSGTGPGAAAELADALARSVAVMPRLRLLRVIDPSGRIVVDNTSPHGHPGINLADRDYFIYHRAHDDSRVRLSGPFLSRTEHLWVVTVSRRIDDRAGRFAGVAEALLARSYFSDRYTGVKWGTKGLRALFRDDGSGDVIVGPPEINGIKSMPDALWFHGSFARMQAASFLDLPPFDHAWRVSAFARSGRYQLLQAVALGADDALTAWRHDAVINFAIAFGMLLIFVALGLFLSAQIERRRAAESARARLALFDDRTGLANRRQFDEVLARAWLAATRRRRTSLAMLMIEPDDFRFYVESYGRTAADEALKAIARVVQENIRPTDLAAADGGETFAVVLPATDGPGAYATAEQIRASVMSLRIEHTPGGGCLTVSIGVAAMMPTVSGEPGLLLVAADRALFEAKSSGYNRSVLRAQADAPVGAAAHTGPDLETPVLSSLIGLLAAEETLARDQSAKVS